MAMSSSSNPGNARCSRRAIIHGLVAAPLATAVISTTIGTGMDQFVPSVNAAEGVKVYTEKQAGAYSFEYPTDWVKQETTISGGRFLVVVSPKDAAENINVSVTATGIPNDFQRLTSFGPVDNVVSSIIPNKKELDGKMLSISTEANQYLFEYQLRPNEKSDLRHLYSVWVLVPGTRLVTLTAQCLDSQFPEYEATFRKIIDSFHVSTNI
eukprot:CAMPEP_0184689658 /NCGR_PEP_ID=MMETSP0312-20130426/30779_1 /TAXON_ID=31354 /ORGANISM="Compsopogon coeruleus, Strain SAG 36.94" /LENGTH=209 /DNA_ID=CAMNT_0027147035 /DNA_START=203 /DNA_END=832 /DNA_ORIENTATION=-